MLNYYSRPDEAGNVVTNEESVVTNTTFKPKNSNKKYATIGSSVEGGVSEIDNKEYKEHLNNSINTRLNNNTI